MLGGGFGASLPSRLGAGPLSEPRSGSRRHILARLLTRLLTGRCPQLTGWGAARPLGIRIGNLLLLLRVENELPLGVKGAIVVHLDAFTFGSARDSRDAAADGLRSGVGCRHATGARCGEDVANHVRGRVALAGSSTGLRETGRLHLRSRHRRIGGRAAEILRVHGCPGLTRYLPW